MMILKGPKTSSFNFRLCNQYSNGTRNRLGKAVCLTDPVLKCVSTCAADANAFVLGLQAVALPSVSVACAPVEL